MSKIALIARAAVAPVDGDVGAELLVDQRRAVGHGGFHVGDRRQLRDVDRDVLRRVERLLARLGDHHGDGVAVEADLVLRQRVVHGDLDVLGDGPDERQPADLQVGRRVHADDARHRLRRGRVDRVHRGVDVRRTHHRHPQHAGEDVVVDEVGLAGDELRVLLAKDLGSDVQLGGRHVDLLRPSRRSWTRRRRGSTSRCSDSRCSGRGCPRATRERPPPSGVGFSFR